MQVHCLELSGITVLSVSDAKTIGALNAAEFRRSVSDALAEKTQVVLDASEIEFFDNDGLDALLSVSEEIRARHGELALAGVGEGLRSFFGMVGVDWAFKIFDSVPEAVAGLVRPVRHAEVWH